MDQLSKTVRAPKPKPFYADMPKSFDELINSERVYLNRKLKNRLVTDFIYFFRAFNNIIFKGARSK